MKNIEFVIAAYGLVGGSLFIYTLFLWQRLKDVKNKLKDLETSKKENE